jgi:hypothetical protein
LQYSQQLSHSQLCGFVRRTSIQIVQSASSASKIAFAGYWLTPAGLQLSFFLLSFWQQLCPAVTFCPSTVVVLDTAETAFPHHDTMVLLLALLLAPAGVSARHAQQYPARGVNLTVAAGFPLEAIRPSLLGLDLEFTRHDIWEGLSAELVANRLFALQPPGTEWPQTWPAGFPPRWAPLPNATVPAVAGPFSALACALTPAAPLCGLQQLPVGDGFDAGLSWGSAIGVEGGRGYTFRAVVRASGTPGGAGLTLGVALAPAVFAANLTVPETGDWVVVEAAFTAPATLARADSLSLWVVGTAGSLAINATSLLPDDAWLGMRRDVVDALRDLAFPGPLRYPGGCFAPFYQWKPALAPLLSRAPMLSPPDYCMAVAGGVNSYSDGFLENGPNIDEYMALVA